MRLLHSLLINGLSFLWDRDIRQARIQLQAKKYSSANATAQKVLRRTPFSIYALRLSGDIASEERNYARAVAFYERAMQICPNNTDLLRSCSYALRQLNKLPEASACLQTVLEHEPNDAMACNDLAILSQLQGNSRSALSYLEKAIAIRMEFFEAWLNKGLVLRDLSRYDEALLAFEFARNLNPQSAVILHWLGVLHRELGQTDQAIHEYHQSMHLDPELPDPICSLGTALADQGEMEAAFDCYEKVIESCPEYAVARMLRGMARLSLGDFERGWKDYEARYSTDETPNRGYPYPNWDGASLARRTILVYGEQGVGDQIMFASCLPEVIAQAKSCVVECNAKLAPLFTRTFPNVVVSQTSPKGDLSRLQSFPEIEVQIAMGSLPRFFRNKIEDFPKHNGYLQADPEKINAWRVRLSTLGSGFKVGVAWQGGGARTRPVVRSIPLTIWQEIFSVSNVHFVSLQFGGTLEEAELVNEISNTSLHHWPDAIQDLDETAALICALDLVVTVCCSVAHLAGALGKPVWVLVPSAPEWRYLRQGERMPWYPQAKIFRQSTPGIWQPVMDQVKNELRAFIEKSSCGG